MDEIERLTEHCRTTLGDPDGWFKPAGYPNSLALCIVDSIFSTGSHYQAVINVVDRYRDLRGEIANTDGTPELLLTFKELGGAAAWADRMQNHKPASTRKGAALKAAVVQQVAEKLDDAGIPTAIDLRLHADPGDDERRRAAKTLWTSTESQSSGLTWEYALILLGLPRVKADRMVVRFVNKAVDSDVAAPRAAQLVLAAAERLQIPANQLDHAIWRQQSGRPVQQAIDRDVLPMPS